MMTHGKQDSTKHQKQLPCTFYSSSPSWEEQLGASKRGDKANQWFILTHKESLKVWGP